MKAKILLDGGSPKVTEAELSGELSKAGFEVGDRGAEIGIVVGGDGRFGRYGRTEEVPLLFVGVKSRKSTGSKAYLAGTYFDELPGALAEIKAGRYKVDEHRRLEVLKNGKSLGEVFTDVYLERGSESTCLRYKLRARGEGVEIDEEAIGDGVVVTTAAGSTGYFSYPDRIHGDSMDPTAFTEIGPDRVGVCHVVPTYTERKGADASPLRYTLPWGSVVELSLFRRADARLYGVRDAREGIGVKLGDKVAVRPGKKITRVISLQVGQRS